MRIVQYQGEARVADIVGRVFGTMSPAERKRAEATLLSMNPHLSDLRALPRGAVILVPEIPGFTSVWPDPTVAPFEAVVAATHSKVEQFGGDLVSATKAEEEAVIVQQRELQALVESEVPRISPELKTMLESLGATFQERARRAQDGLDFIKNGLGQMVKDLDELATTAGS